MRIFLGGAILLIGLALGFASYFALAAPLGTPTNDGFSDPSVPFAATLFVVGIVLVFLSVVLYELLPTRSGESRGTEPS